MVGSVGVVCRNTKTKTLLVCGLCLLPTITCFIANAAALQPPAKDIMTQRRQSASESSSTGGATTPTRNADSSSATRLFPPSSTFHPDRNGLARRCRWLVVDFDGTCTAHDTTPLLPTLAALATASRRQRTASTGGANNVRESSDEKEASGAHHLDLQRRLSQFQCLENEYVRLFGEAKSTLLSSASHRRSAGEEGDEQEQPLHDVLDALDEPSVIVTQLVSESAVLRGLGHLSARELEGMLQLRGVSTAVAANGATADDFGLSGEQTESVDERQMERGADLGDASGRNAEDKVLVRLRDGCESTLARILLGDGDENADCDGEPPPPSGWNLAVLSINWCPALIDAALVRPVLRKRRSILQIDSCTTEIPIWSNEVDGDGVVSLHVPGSLAKRERIAELRRQILRAGEGGQQGSVIVYVGDSSTDLAALLEADIGIVMGSSSTTTAIAKRYGIRIVPLQHRQQHGFGSENNRSTDDDHVGNWRKMKLLWQVDSWQEVDQMLIELDEC